MDWEKTTAREHKKHLNFEIWCDGTSGQYSCFFYATVVHRDIILMGPLLLTWFNFNPSMDK